jgi:DNA uptake protein ComE-like DNA-binding protein
MDKTAVYPDVEVDLDHIDLNSSPEEELAEISWIGPDLARAIVERRPLRNMRSLLQIPGFTEDKMDRLIRGGAVVRKPQEVSG